MVFQMRGIDHQPVGLACFPRKRLENPVEDAEPAPAAEPVIERLVWAVFLRRIFPLKSMLQKRK
ncbi:hypothetical protein D3C86_2132640 [compost metagenome]